MNSPTFDSGGSPTQETLDTISNWSGSFFGLMEFVKEAWRHDYGKIWEDKGDLKMATGGWSANEEIAGAIHRNHLFWALYWKSSHRGGLDVFTIPTKP